LSRGAINEVANKFEVSRLTISRIWQMAKKQYEEGKISADVSSKKVNCGRKRKDYSENLKRIKHIPINRRGTIRSLSCAIDVPKSTVFRRFKEGKHLKWISSTVKPTFYSYITYIHITVFFLFCIPYFGTKKKGKCIPYIGTEGVHYMTKIEFCQ
jgi:hypothetical protein